MSAAERRDRGVPHAQLRTAYQSGQRASMNSERWEDSGSPMDDAFDSYQKSPRSYPLNDSLDGATHHNAFLDGWTNFDNDDAELTAHYASDGAARVAAVATTRPRANPVLVEFRADPWFDDLRERAESYLDVNFTDMSADASLWNWDREDVAHAAKVLRKFVAVYA